MTPARKLHVVGDTSDARPRRVTRFARHEVRLRDEQRLPIADKPLHTRTEVADDPATWSPAVWLVAAHGGAGTTTLSHMLAPFGDAGRRWPAADDNPWCVVVARENYSGLEAAQQVLLQAATGQAGECSALGVVTVADGPGKRPKKLASNLRVIEEISPVWRVGWIPDLKVTNPADIASWRPGQATPAKRKRRRRVPIDQDIPDAVKTTAFDILQLAADNHAAQNEKE